MLDAEGLALVSDPAVAEVAIDDLADDDQTTSRKAADQNVELVTLDVGSAAGHELDGAVRLPGGTVEADESVVLLWQVAKPENAALL